MKKPVIGIVAKHMKASGARLNTFIRDEVEQAIFDNGGIAIGILPPNEGKISSKNDWYNQLTTTEKHNLYDQLSICDGVILQGGDYTDEYECVIAKFCHDYNIPLLGICAGKHMMVRALGGQTARLDTDEHNQPDKAYAHKITIVKGSRAHKLIGKEEVMVNSRHKNHATKLVGLNLVAVADDGVDEIVEDPNKRFFIGVQFHPESLYKHDPYMNNIFVGFLKACNKRAPKAKV